MSESLFGAKVYTSKWMADDRIVAMGDIGETPDNWDTMTENEKLAYAVAHGAVVMVSEVGWDRLKTALDKVHTHPSQYDVMLVGCPACYPDTQQGGHE